MLPLRRFSLPLALFFGGTVICTQTGNAVTPTQNAPTVTASFDAFWAAARDEPFPQQEVLWNTYVEGPREALYRSVVWEVRDNPEWQVTRRKMLQMRFGQYPRIAPAVPMEARDIETQLHTQTAKLRTLFPGAAAAPRAVIVLAPNFDAKSGVMPDGTPVLALAVDSLALEKADLRILLPHELFHLYDAQHAGVENDGVMPNTSLVLPLFAEGLATYVSSVASPGYAEGQYLFQSDLGKLPPVRLKAAARDFLDIAGTMTIDPVTHATSPLFARWFESDRKPLNPGYPNRAGYWLGMNLIRQLRRTYSLQQMASWPPAEAQRKMLAALSAMAQ